MDFVPDNGTAYIAAAVGDSLAFSFQDNSLFGVASVDLAAYSTVRPNTAIHFVGYQADGSTLTTIVERQGINFETHYFGPEWSSGLTRVEVPFPLWSMDNLVVVIPEPSTAALLVTGGIMFSLRTLKRRK